jgi:hypothetical protein
MCHIDAGEEITENNKTWLNLECRFLDYDGVKFGEAGIFLRGAMFRGFLRSANIYIYVVHKSRKILSREAKRSAIWPARISSTVTAGHSS